MMINSGLREKMMRHAMQKEIDDRRGISGPELTLTQAEIGQIMRLLAPTPAPPASGEIEWPAPKVTNPDIPVPTGVPYLDCLLHRLMDAQQNINVEANERMSQSLADASALIDELEVALRKLAAPRSHPQAPASGEAEPLTYDERVEMLRLADDLVGAEVTELDTAKLSVVVKALRMSAGHSDYATLSLSQPASGEAAGRIARFFLENSEHFTWVGTPLDQPNPTGKYVCSISPSHPDGLLRPAEAHREKRIAIWAAALKASGILTTFEAPLAEGQIMVPAKFVRFVEFYKDHGADFAWVQIGDKRLDFKIEQLIEWDVDVKALGWKGELP